MSKKLRVLAVTGLAVIFGLTLSGPAFALFPDPPGGMDNDDGGVGVPAIPELGNLEHGECVEDLLNLPALNSCVDAQGRVIMDLPAVNLVGPRPGRPAAQPRRLPVTGVNVGDFAAIGAAALAGGAALVRRVRLALAS